MNLTPSQEARPPTEPESGRRKCRAAATLRPRSDVGFACPASATLGGQALADWVPNPLPSAWPETKLA